MAQRCQGRWSFFKEPQYLVASCHPMMSNTYVPIISASKKSENKEEKTKHLETWKNHAKISCFQEAGCEQRTTTTSHCECLVVHSTVALPPLDLGIPKPCCACRPHPNWPQSKTPCFFQPRKETKENPGCFA